MKNLNDLQKKTIENWEGKTVLSLYPNGFVSEQTFQNTEEMKFQSEEYECAMQILDNLKIPRTDLDGKTYSLVGRIMKIKEIK